MKKTFILLSTAFIFTSASCLASPQNNNDTIPIKHPNVFMDMSNFFDQVNRNYLNNANIMAAGSVAMNNPKADVYETKDDIVVKIDLPGIEKDKVKLEVFQEYISLGYEKEKKKEEKTETYHVSERSYGSFHRVISIPDDGDIQKADSEYKDGVLTITIPKSEDKKPRSKVLEI